MNEVYYTEDDVNKTRNRTEKIDYFSWRTLGLVCAAVIGIIVITAVVIFVL